MRLRTARNAAAYFKAIDSETQITEWFIRTLMDKGDLPVIQNGSKRLTSIEAIESYIEKQLRG